MSAEETIVTSGGTATATEEETRTRQIPPYNVILLNDELHSFEFVVETLQKSLGVKLERAQEFAMEAHEQGRCIIWTGTKEVAELKQEQIKSRHEKRGEKDLGPLGVDIEPAN